MIIVRVIVLMMDVLKKAKTFNNSKKQKYLITQKSKIKTGVCMMKGMSATNLIVSLAVGLIVIVGLGYLVWTWLGQGGGKVSEAYCNGEKLAFCVRWSADGYQTTDGPDGTKWEGTNNGKKCITMSGFETVSIANCKSLLGQS